MDDQYIASLKQADKKARHDHEMIMTHVCALVRCLLVLNPIYMTDVHPEQEKLSNEEKQIAMTNELADFTKVNDFIKTYGPLSQYMHVDGVENMAKTFELMKAHNKEHAGLEQKRVNYFMSLLD